MIGARGGEIVAEGTPEQVAEARRSYTGGYLKPLLAKQPPAVVEERAVRKGRKRVAA